MKKYQVTVIVWFFMTLSVIVCYRYISTAAPSPEILKKRTELETARLDLTLRNLERNDLAMFYGAAIGAGVICLCLVIVAAGEHRAKVKRASVHLYKFANGIEIWVSERDLAVAAPIGLGLMNAAQLKEMNGGMERAFELAARMQEVQCQQFQALTDLRSRPAALPDASAPLPAAPTEHKTPSFRELITAGAIAPGKPFILCYTDGAPRYGAFQTDIQSAAVAGESGSGKTGTLLYLIGAGIVAQNARFWGLDPHYPHPKSLGAKTRPLWEKGLMRMATRKDEMLHVLRNVEQVIDARLSQQDVDTTPLVLVIDELAFLSKTSIGDKIAGTMERVAMEGRKCNVCMLAASQTWLAARTGDTSIVRDTLTSSYVHRLKPKQAQVLLQDRDEVNKVKQIKAAGRALLCPVGDTSVICEIPYTDADDICRVAALCPPVSDTRNTQPTQPATHLTQPITQPTQPTQDAVWLREKMAGLQLSKEAAAEKMGLSVSMVKEVLRGARSLKEERKVKLV
jgi:hypothetical protein